MNSKVTYSRLNCLTNFDVDSTVKISLVIGSEKRYRLYHTKTKLKGNRDNLCEIKNICVKPISTQVKLRAKAYKFIINCM